MKELSEQDEYIPFGEPAHYIQRDIMTVIKEAVTPLSYSDLKPPGIDGNAFNHHLRSLITKDILSKTLDNKYVLTARGKRSIDFYSLSDTRIKLRPVPGVFVLVRSTDSMVLTYRNSAAPIGGHIGILFGKLRLSGDYINTLDRILARRNLKPKAISSHGAINIMYFQNDELVAQRCGPLFVVELTDLADKESEYSSFTQKLEWKSLNDIKSEEILAAVKLSGNIKENYLDLRIEV